MRQLDLFSSLFDTSTEEKPEEKQAVAKKAEPAKEKESPSESYSMVELAVELLNDQTQENYTDDFRIDDLGSALNRNGNFEFPDKKVTTIELKEEVEAIVHVVTENYQQSFLQEPIETVATKTRKPTVKETPAKETIDESIIFTDGKIRVKLKSKPVVTLPVVKEKQEKEKKVPQKRGRKSFKEIDAEVDLIEIPEDEVLFQKQYYPISEVAKWFRVNTSLLRFWENEFEVLKPRKNRKGDRLFRPEDVKNLQLIYQLLRQRKYTIEGAKEYIKTNRKKADTQLQLTQTLQKFKSFLLDLKANLQP